MYVKEADRVLKAYEGRQWYSLSDFYFHYRDACRDKEEEVSLFGWEQEEKGESETFIWWVLDTRGEGKNERPLIRQDRQWEVVKSN